MNIMLSTIIKAILYLAPHLTSAEAGLYARLVEHETSRVGIPSLLVVAIVQGESGWNRIAKGKASEYGLTQVRVSRTNYPELLGHEYLLMDPALNLHLGIKLMAYWRRYHYKRCFPHHQHPWWAHIQWGKKIGDGGKRARKRVGRIYRQLIERYGK
jgi:soluble lytic murein transglycosylase-like protein